MTEPTLNLRRSHGPRIKHLAMATVGITIVMLALVWRHASAYRPTGAQEASSAAGVALHVAGLPWASVRVTETTAILVGRAPDDLSRVLAYQVARRALRPLMGQDAVVRELRSAVALHSDARPRELHRIPGAPALDVAALLPPPMPHGHRPAIVTSALAAPHTADAGAEKPAADVPSSSETTREDEQTATKDGPIGEATETTPHGAETSAYVPTAASEPSTQAAATSPSDEDASNTASRAPTAPNVKPLAPPSEIETAAIQSSTHAEQTVLSCMQAFEAALVQGTVHFAVGSAAIQKESRPLLDDLAAIAKRCRAYRLTVEGHTDLTGGKTHNLDLSRRRAEAVRRALIDRGIDIDHISAKGLGETRPVVRGTSEADNARNRRIVITVAGG